MMSNIKVIQAINNSPFKAFFAITGGGQTFIGDYMKVSGASKTVIGALVPYSQYEFDKFVGGKVDSYCSEEAARKLAVAAYNRCIEAGVETCYAIGIGVTCSLAKDNEREGRIHNIHICAHARNFTYIFHSIPNVQGNSTTRRDIEEFIAAKQILYILNQSTVKEMVSSIDSLCEKAILSSVDGELYSDVLEGKRPMLLSSNFDDEQTVIPIYPGSWNPLHEGHEQIAKVAKEILGAPVVFELSVKNADKGQLDAVDIKRRVEAVQVKYPLALTNASTFVEKAIQFRRRFPKDQIVFVVGADTWNRLWDPKYAGPPSEVESILGAFDVKFLVFGRGTIPIYQGAGERLRIHHELRATEFDMDISSTNLRKK